MTKFDIGTKVQHIKYGAGKIIDTDKNTVLINFPDTNENRRFLKKSAMKHSIFTILTKAPGLYDENDNLVADWDELIRNKKINIEENALIKCGESLTGKLIIDDSVTSIGDYAFCYCTSLTSITIPNGVTNIGNWAFSHCTSLTSIAIPNSITSIGNFAFSYCASLTSITVPDSVTSISKGAFEFCSSLINVTMPNSITSISHYAFCSCVALTNITIPDSVTIIGGFAFNHCKLLTNITIPDSVTSIGDFAFGYCTSLKNIYFNSTKLKWKTVNIDSSAFKYCPTMTVHCTNKDIIKKGR